MRLRPYRRADCVRCLAVFWSNVPAAFLEGDVDDYMAFLDDLPGPYLVGERDGDVVACGGYAPDGDGAWALCWGMVRREAQGQGFGRALLLARLHAIAQEAPGARVRVHTTPEVSGFFECFGFRIVRTIPDGYARGVDRCELELELDAEAVAAIQAAWADVRASGSVRSEAAP